MKRILFAILGVAAIAACSKTEVVSISEGNAIKFDNAFVGNPTKAGLPTGDQVTTANIKHFYAYASHEGGEVFNKQKVYPSNGVWVYDGLKKWEQNKTYKFAAYTAYKKIESENATDYSIDPTFDYGSHTLKIENYVSDSDNQYDLLMALSNQNLNGTDAATANVPVQFSFKHALAMIKFTLKNGLGNNALEISTFKVKGVNTKGNVSISNPSDPTITWDNHAELLNFTCDDFTIPANGIAESAEFVVIPQTTIGEVTVTFNVKVSTNDGEINKVLTSKIPAQTWNSGMRYNYVATITGTDMDVIEFEAPTVSDWDTYPDADIDID